MDPAIVLFGFGIGLLVGMTGMGGASLMTPLLILIFKTRAGHRDRHRHLLRGRDQDGRRRSSTCAPAPSTGAWRSGWRWAACPSAIGGVFVIELLQDAYGEDDARADRLRHPRRHPAGRRDLDAAADDLHPGRDQGALRPPPPAAPHHRRGRDRPHHRLRDRPDLGRLGDADRDHPDRRLPADAAAGRRHRHLPRGRAALGGRRRALGRRQRRLRPRRQHPGRLDPRRPRRRQARAEDRQEPAPRSCSRWS